MSTCGSMLKLTVIILTIGYHQDVMLKKMAEAYLQVTPLWDSTDHVTQYCLVKKDNDEGIVFFQGSLYHSCSLQVNVSTGSATLLEVNNVSVAEDSFFYIERMGELTQCNNTNVVLDEQDGGCYIVFVHSSLQFNLQGNVRVIISEISATEPLLWECPDVVPNDHAWLRLNQTPKCYNVKGYNKSISCATQNDHKYWNRFKDFLGLCSFDFPLNCNASLGKREVVFSCGESNSSQNKTVLMNYPSGMSVLDLVENNIVEISAKAFLGLNKLQKLYLTGNLLVALPETLLQGLNELTLIELGRNRLSALPSGLFHGLERLSALYLYENQLVGLDAGLFHGLGKLTQLSLFTNKLKTLPQGLLWGLGNVSELYLYDNQLVTIEGGFQGLGMLSYLDLFGNKLKTLSAGVFQGLNNLNILFLDYNNLVQLHPNMVNSLPNLKVLALQYNMLTQLDGNFFRGLIKLESIGLDGNQFVSLGNDIFKDLTNLDSVFLNENLLKVLDFEIFQNAVNLTFIDMSKNKLDEIPNLKVLKQLKYLNLKGNPLEMIERKDLSILPANTELFVSQHEICECYAPVDVNCSAANDRSPYLTCDRLLADRTLAVLMWFIGFNALFGNVFVLAWRQKVPQKNKVQTLLLSSLAMSDLLMGIYMLIIASADVYFGEHFPMQSETWRSGITCRIAGAISITSSEASVFFVTLISIDRLISVRFPYTTKKFNRESTVIIVFLTWMFSFALGIIPSVLAGISFKFYDNSHVCIGLPLALTEIYSNVEFIQKVQNVGYHFSKHTFKTQSKGTTPGMYFSTSIFLGLNCACYLIILGCYIEIMKTAYKSSKRAGLNQEMKEQLRMTAKVAAIVATDFCCWSPVIFLGILVQTRVLTLPPSVFTWCVTFVLPINSAVNPYLYTIAAIISSRHKKQQMFGNWNQQNTAAMKQIPIQNQDTLQIVSVTHHPSLSAWDESIEPLPNVPIHLGAS